MPTISSVQTAHSGFASSILEAIRRAAIQLPDVWRWVQYTHTWDTGNFVYQADNRLQSYTLTQGSAVLTVTLTYNSDGRVATITLAGPAGNVIVTPTYTSGNITAMAVSVV
jgi:YD repeat-containing protein